MSFQTINGIFGMKLNGNQFSALLKKARALSDPIDPNLNDAEVLDIFFPNVLYIHLKRRDKVKQALSFSKGMQTGIWRIAAEAEDPSQYALPPVYDRQHIEACLDKLLAIDISWEDYLRTHELNALEIWYENLAQDYAQTIVDIYNYLGIQVASMPEPLLKKQANRQSDNWAQRFRDETTWLHQSDFTAALAQGDFRRALNLRFIEIAYRKEESYWQSMPISHFKKGRKLYYRLLRKIIKMVKMLR